MLEYPVSIGGECVCFYHEGHPIAQQAAQQTNGMVVGGLAIQSNSRSANEFQKIPVQEHLDPTQ